MDVKHEAPAAMTIEKVESGGDSGRSSQDDPTHGENKVTFSFFMTMVGMCLAFVVAEITPLFLVTCFTIIAADLNALDKIIWILTAPYIATGAVAPFVGNLSDLIGRRGILLLSLVLVIVAFILQGAAPNIATFLVGGVLAGAAIGIQILVVIAAASELVPMHKRGATIGYLAMGLIPFAAAPLYGQSIAATNWRFIYLLLGLIAVLAFIVLAIFYKPPPRPASQLSKMQLLARIDYIGCLLSISGVVLFLVGINFGGQDYAWNSGVVIACLTSGLALLVIFGIYEKWIVKYPMFPARLIQKKRHFFAVSVLCLTSGVNFVPLTVFWTIQTFSVYGANFSDAGRWLMPLGFCIIGGAGISAVLISLFRKRIMWILLGFCIMQTVGIACLATFDPQNINSVWAPMVFGLIGVGAVLLPSQVVFSVISPDDLIGTSVALSVVIRMIGQVIGKSMFYNIFKQTVTRNAYDIIPGPAVAVGFFSIPRITSLVTYMGAGPLRFYVDRGVFPEITRLDALPQLITAGQQVYAKSFPILYLLSIPWGVLAVFSCLLLYGVDQYIDEHVAVHM
ncbi:hypothetical protein AMS68_004112 [Peltaster fructicola]|uniref:Major facilitator superfamily (MFS) profile domain-containing protein n=1 Tax=Peltaster fructicola TaxID=286661 RepID=A0A6H0XVB4_9PEZI|nr:hypothetical protein AMS68_004112 [Peltaster fructicola]